ncbi:uncharacterized protein HD556DRAFT_866304 [Suillus plorans]|uniref:Uncharacterized protein n=1 Tax=Suillus plorans TaxID=116603 RepID=A0A9P7DCF1_9AGAM|nr:uncharacterized protein HD556DRAFT_866304 [Suillus plorans]KAG1788375.1 hypothetical protein HD556DRAFT_866304 [Suillus plorans]
MTRPRRVENFVNLSGSDSEWSGTKTSSPRTSRTTFWGSAMSTATTIHLHESRHLNLDSIYNLGHSLPFLLVQVSATCAYLSQEFYQCIHPPPHQTPLVRSSLLASSSVIEGAVLAPTPSYDHNCLLPKLARLPSTKFIIRFPTDNARHAVTELFNTDISGLNHSYLSASSSLCIQKHEPAPIPPSSSSYSRTPTMA